VLPFPWQTVVDGGTIVAILGAILALGKRIGAQDREMETLRQMMNRHEQTSESHTLQLAAGEGDFKVINTKLDTITEGQKELRTLLLDHITQKDGKP
jgi:hypothetical protein